MRARARRASGRVGTLVGSVSAFCPGLAPVDGLMTRVPVASRLIGTMHFSWVGRVDGSSCYNLLQLAIQNCVSFKGEVGADVDVPYLVELLLRG